MPQALLQWAYSYSAYSFGLALAIYFGGLSLLSMTPPDFRTSRWLVSIACMWMGAAGLIWVFKTEEALLVRCVTGLGFGVIVFCLWPGTIRYITHRQDVASKSSVNVTMTIAQIQELQRVTELLGGKDEYALEQTFDFHGYVKFGLLRAKQVVDPDKVSKAQSDEMEQYFQNWIAAVMNPSLTRITQVNEGVPRVEPQPGVPFIFRLPRAYSLAKAQLLPFETSPEMPKDIQEAIKDFDRTLDENAHLLITVVHEKLTQDKNNIILEDDPNSPYLGVTLTAYWKRFSPLKPKADAVLAAIRKFYGVR